MSESLTRNACRIDFSKDLDETETSTGTISKTAIKEEKEDEEMKDVDRFSANLWPWDSVRNKLRDAMTEVCVLSDVLSIAKRKQYMVLDPVPQDPQTVKPIVQIFARKKALANAANILLTGAEQLRSSQSEAKNNRNVSDFHIELLRLRQVCFFSCANIDCFTMKKFKFFVNFNKNCSFLLISELAIEKGRKYDCR